MTRYGEVKEDEIRKRKIHPIWRGVGFILIILIPIISYIGTLVLLETNMRNNWVVIPPSLLISGKDPYLLLKIILTICLIFILGCLFTLITFFLTSIFAPPRYGPYDIPPVPYRGKRYKR